MTWLYLHDTLRGTEPETRGLALFRVERQQGWFVRMPAETVGVGRREPPAHAPARWIAVAIPTLSRWQFALEHSGGRYTVVDRHSAGGTFVNGERAAGNLPLQHGDVVSAGELRVTFLERLP